MRPSTFLFEASLSTEQKLATTHIMRVPNKTELLDMGDTSLQKVGFEFPLYRVMMFLDNLKQILLLS